MTQNFFIYRIRNELSGKSYIGWTINVQKRWRRHINDAVKGRQNAIHRALAKYGPGNFSFTVLEEAEGSSVEAHAREIWWIASEGTLSPSGYNMTEGGDGAHDLGQLAAASHARRRALDPEADRAARSERTRKSNESMPIGARSQASKDAWKRRSPEARAAFIQAMRNRAATESAEVKSARARKAHEAFTSEQRSERARKANAALRPEQRQAALAAMHAAMSPEDRSRAGKLGAAAKQANTTHEQRSAACALRWKKTTPEQSAARSRKISETQKAMSPERRADIARRRWETRRRNAAENPKLIE